jgi:hypothetical protein
MVFCVLVFLFSFSFFSARGLKKIEGRSSCLVVDGLCNETLSVFFFCPRKLLSPF